MTQLLDELRSIPAAVIERLLSENIAEHDRLRARCVPADAPVFEENCALYLVYEKALAERGIRVAA